MCILPQLKKRGKIPFTLLPSMLTSCKSIVSQPGYWHWYNENIEQIHQHKNLSCYPFEVILLSLSPHLSFPPQIHDSVLHFYSFIIPRMLYKWNHRVFIIVALLVQFFRDAPPFLGISLVRSFLQVPAIPWYGYTSISSIGGIEFQFYKVNKFWRSVQQRYTEHYCTVHLEWLRW